MRGPEVLFRIAAPKTHLIAAMHRSLPLNSSAA